MKARWSFALFALSTTAACVGEPIEEEVGESEQAASATMKTTSFTTSLASSPQDLGGLDIVGEAAGTTFDLHVGAEATWSASVATDVTWDSDDVRQGAGLSVSRVGTAQDGTIQVAWTVSGTVNPLGLGNIDIGTIPLSADVTSCKPRLLDCPPELSPSDLADCIAAAGTYDCSATSSGVSLVDTPFVPASPYVDLAIGVDFTITPNGAVTTRSFFSGGVEITPQTDLHVTKQAGIESFDMPCSRPAGESVDYVLDPYQWTPAALSASQQPKFEIGIRDPILGATKLPPIFSDSFGPALVTSPVFELSGAGSSVHLGELLANNVPPTIATLPLFSGEEGTPVSFSATTTSQCPITSFVWQFSDGTTSFGPTPKRAFGDDGPFDGQLAVTDSTNLSATGNFSVQINNRPPSANAGPDTSGVWGQPIALHGQAVDPGAGDQATLVYSWDFGDGTPGAGGANVAHAYALPGDYVATLTVCDDHQPCANDTVNVHVRRRTTVVAYTGATTGVFSATAALGASIVDELGQPVVDGPVAFTLAGNAAGSAQTNASGNASRIADVTVPAGSYVVSATYAGSTSYEGNASTGSFAVTPMATSLQYTGALSGAPNKTVTLSAKLVDALGRPLDGKVVVFVLGAQQTQATTGASGAAGVAAASLKLTQKNGNYPLTSTFSPTGADAAKWVGASAVTSFSLQSK